MTDFDIGGVNLSVSSTIRSVALDILTVYSVACSPQANYTDRATAACQRS
jgi:hypothetical protein